MLTARIAISGLQAEHVGYGEPGALGCPKRPWSGVGAGHYVLRPAGIPDWRRLRK
jgi:hypothetical protein